MNALPSFQAQTPPAFHVDYEAEQALLGIVLLEGEAFWACDGLSAEHFGDETHARIWRLLAEVIGRGDQPQPTLLAQRLGSDPALTDLGGASYYLALLVDKAPAAVSLAPKFAEAVREAHGRRSLVRLAGDLGERARQGEPVRELVGSAEASLLAMQVTTRETRLVSAREASARVLADLDAPSEKQRGVFTGWAPMDEQLGAFQPGDLVLFMGRPSMGKSAAAECVGLNIAEQITDLAPSGYGVIQINGEMSPEQMTRRHLTDICFRLYGFRGPKYSDIRKRLVTPEQRAMLGEADQIFRALNMEMIKRPGLKLSNLRSLVRRQTARWARQDVPLGAVIIDHVGLIHPDEKSRDRYADQTAVSNGLKELADELQCPIIALNQMNRQNENRDDKRPQLSDLRDSGSWEQDADIVIGWYREAYYAAREPEPKDTGKPDASIKWAEWDQRRRSKTIEAIVLKAREGECGTVELWGDVARNAIRGSKPDDRGMF